MSGEGCRSSQAGGTPSRGSREATRGHGGTGDGRVLATAVSRTAVLCACLPWRTLGSVTPKGHPAGLPGSWRCARSQQESRHGRVVAPRRVPAVATSSLAPGRLSACHCQSSFRPPFHVLDYVSGRPDRAAREPSHWQREVALRKVLARVLLRDTERVGKLAEPK